MSKLNDLKALCDAIPDCSSEDHFWLLKDTLPRLLALIEVMRDELELKAGLFWYEGGKKKYAKENKALQQYNEWDASDA